MISLSCKRVALQRLSRGQVCPPSLMHRRNEYCLSSSEVQRCSLLPGRAVRSRAHQRAACRSNRAFIAATPPFHVRMQRIDHQFLSLGNSIIFIGNLTLCDLVSLSVASANQQNINLFDNTRRLRQHRQLSTRLKWHRNAHHLSIQDQKSHSTTFERCDGARTWLL